MPEPSIITFGCRLNAYESEAMRQHAIAAGLADAVVVNTCAVTAEAMRQAGQAIRKARRERPRARIIVTGCGAQTDPARFAAMADVDHVIGNAGKLEFATWTELAASRAGRVAVNDIMAERQAASPARGPLPRRARAYVAIQNGCDHRCTFCIIPFGRGNSRSLPAGEAVAQVRRLVDGGTTEVVLTGVDITAYGRDLPGRLTLGGLVQKILKLVPDLPRLRLSSIDSVEVDPALAEAIAGAPRLMPHLHLSLQAGDDLTLKRMKRRHSRDDSIRFCRDIKAARPDVVFGADLIAGFPTETEAMFESTMQLVDACELTFLHVFPYSPRPGTPAARMPQVAPTAIKERAARLRRKGAEMLARHLDHMVGGTVDSLVECGRLGRTPQFAEVLLDRALDDGKVVSARITGHDGKRLSGAVIDG